MDSIEKDAMRIFGARAAYYTTSAAHVDPQILARVVELAAPGPDWVALDVATGTGHTAFAVAPHVRQVIGIDLTVEMLAESRKLQRARGISRVSFQLADVHDLPFSARAFHLVTCRRATHHFSKIVHAIEEIARVLSPGGRVVIDDRSVPEDDFVDTCMNLLDRHHDPSHVREYRPSEWQRLLGDHGFAVEVIEGYVKHRPVTALTDNASPENVRKIHEVLEGLTAAQCAALNLTTVNGEPHLNHWYVLIAASRR